MRRPPVLLLALLVFTQPVHARQVTANWRGGTGFWHDSAMWDIAPEVPHNLGERSYGVVIPAGDVRLEKPAIVEELTLAGGNSTLRGGGQLDVRSALTLAGGVVRDVTIRTSRAATFSGLTNLSGVQLVLSGHTTWAGQLGLGSGSVIEVRPGATVDLWDGAVYTLYAPNSWPYSVFQRTFNNFGTINTAGAVTLDGTLNNSGTINAIGGSITLAGGGTLNGNIHLLNGATMKFARNFSPSTDYIFAPNSSISGMGSVTFDGNYAFSISGAYNITGTTTVRNAQVAFVTPVSNLGAGLIVDGQFALCDLGANSVTLGSLNLRAGAMSGSGTVTVDGPLEWNAGDMSGGGTTIANNGVFFNGVTGSTDSSTLNRALNCYGSSTTQTNALYSHNLNFGLNAALTIMPGANFNGTRLSIHGSSTSGQTYGVVRNYGTLIIDNSAVNRGMSVFGTAFVNEGDIRINNSTLDVRGTTAEPFFVQNAGSIQLTNGKLASDRTHIKGGSLSGYGSIGNTVSRGLIAPSRGINCNNGTLTLEANSVLAYALNGTEAGISHGTIMNASTVILGGALEVTVSKQFRAVISSSNTFTLVSAQTLKGEFANVVSGSRLAAADGCGSFLVTYSGQSVVLSDFLPADRAAFPSRSR